MLKLLFQLATWHGLAKLRVHTDESLQIMDDITATLGDELRSFQSNTCSAFSTRELKREAEGRYRRKARTKTLKDQHPKEDVPSPAGARHEKTLNLQTYKVHALGDYTEAIRRYGTTDSYSTQPVSHFLS